MQNNDKIRDGQRLALMKLFGRFTKNRSCRLWLISQLLDKTISSTDELTIGDWRLIRNQTYPDWAEDNWDIAKEFSVKVHALVYQYEEEVLGQKSLF